MTTAAFLSNRRAPRHGPGRVRARVMWGALGLALLAGLIGARLYLNDWATDYVNRVLNRIEGYKGSISGIDIDLYRGAYRIHDLKIEKKNGNIPVPFITVATVDFSVQWSALLHGRIVSDAELERPELNFAVNRSGTQEQTGAGVDWSKPIRELMPIDINRVSFSNGKLSYKDFSTKPVVDVFIENMRGELRNLRNAESASGALPSSLSLRGDSIGNGVLTASGKMNILKPVPDMDINMQLEHVKLRALSDYSNAYAAIDLRGGSLNLYYELTIRDGKVSGYAKPIATGVQIIDLRQTSNPIKLAWETLVAAVVEIFTNQPRDQFATKIPLEGNLNNIETDSWSAVAGIVRNAFIEAFKKGYEGNIE